MKCDLRQFLADHDAELVVCSRDRADVLARFTDRIACDYVLFHRGAGYDRDYQGCVQKIEVPPGVDGLPATRNHVLRTLDQKVVVFLDDDVRTIYWLGEGHPIRTTVEHFPIMVMNLIVNALDAHVGVFGISEADIRKNSPLAPFHTRAMIGGLIGVVGRDAWFDERNTLKVDYDYCLQRLKRERLVWKDLRYFLFQDRNNLPGGNMQWRTREREEAEVENLRRWWGEEMFRWSSGKGMKRLGVHLGG